MYKMRELISCASDVPPPPGRWIKTRPAPVQTERPAELIARCKLIACNLTDNCYSLRRAQQRNRRLSVKNRKTTLGHRCSGIRFFQALQCWTTKSWRQVSHRAIAVLSYTSLGGLKSSRARSSSREAGQKTVIFSMCALLGHNRRAARSYLRIYTPIMCKFLYAHVQIRELGHAIKHRNQQMFTLVSSSLIMHKFWNSHIKKIVSSKLATKVNY